MTLVTIVTVVHNAADTLERAIKSVIAQTHPDIEYIVIDGGSTDGTIDIIRKYDAYIDYWISEPDDGISSAFNKGIRAASGEMIGILSGDDWYQRDAVRIALLAFNAHPAAGAVCGNAQYHDSAGVAYVATADPEAINREMTINHAATFVRKSVYQQFGLFDESYRFAMDYELMLRFKLAGVRFARVSELICNVQRSGASDRNWLVSIAEVRRAKQLHGERFVRLYQLWMIVRSLSSRTLSSVGLSALVAIFRRRLSIVKKY
jgi:glycosyltransferase involved in cell wall biosynthesis